jgi:uncharacterized protein (UPF0335 family)
MSEHQTVESVDLARLRELESRATPGPWFSQLGTLRAEGCAVALSMSVADCNAVAALRNAFPHLLARIERLEAEIADLRHDVERAVASASDLATELVRKDAALREALPFVESTYENESGEEAADAKYVMDKITAALEQSNG